MAYFKYDGALAAETGPEQAFFSNHDGAETTVGTSGADSIWGGAGDVLKGGAGNDIYWLQADRSLVTIVEAPGGGVDTVAGWQSLSLANYANIENVRVECDGGYAAGNHLDNIVQGGAGSQQLYGGGGQDVLIGGAGADVFIVYKGEGNDVIQDFSAAEDKVRLKAGFTTFDQVKSHMTQVGTDVKLDLGDGDGLMFRNITIGQFTASNFQLQLDPTALGGQTFADEFSGPLSLWDAESNPTGVWRPDFGYQGSQGKGSYTLVSNDEKQIYTSPYFRDHPGDFGESPFVSNPDGTLSIWATPSANPEIFGYGYTSGMITTQATFSQTYGYFEMRADLPDAAGAWPAFWMLPADGSWPPELDIMETLTADPNAAWTTEHSSIGGHSANGMLSYIPDTADGFHTYGVLWTSDNLVWYIDGVEVFRAATPADMNKPMFMLANLALGGWGGAIDASQLPAEFKIDYIRAYGLPGTGGATTAPPPATPAPADPVDPTGGTADPVPAAGLVLTSTVYGDTLTGGAGGDTLTAGRGPDQMTGGAGADHFVFTDLPWTAGRIGDFELGVDKLDLSALLTQSGYAGSDPIADGYVKLVDNGQGGTWVYFDTDGAGSADPWGTFVVTLDGVAPSGVTWAQLAAAETSGGTTAPETPQTSTPAPGAGPGQLIVSQAYGDVLAGGAGCDTLMAGQGPDQLTGGGGGDVFCFEKLVWTAGRVCDFEVGVDRLDLSALLAQSGYAGTDPVADGYVKLIDNGQGGTWIYFDTDGTGSGDQWGTFLTTLDGVAAQGLAWADLSPPPPPAGEMLVSSGYGEALTGGAGGDTLVAGQGPDQLTGGDGADHFVFGKLPWTAGHVTDFQAGVDKIDVSALLAQSGYAGSDPIADGYVKLIDNGQGGTWVYFDTDGTGAQDQWGTFLTTLDQVAPSGLTSTDWIFH